MSEKLERVKSRQDELIKLLPHDLYLDVYYLYEQAERVEELEKQVERQKSDKYRCFKEKQRYREVLEKITVTAPMKTKLLEDGSWGYDFEDALKRINKIAYKALEYDSHDD